MDKITQSITMVKRAIKHGFRVKYVLTDRGFSSKGFIQAMRQIKNHALHGQYTYQGKKLDAKALLAALKQEGHAKRCRKLHTRYFDVVVSYEGVGDATLYLCRFTLGDADENV